MVLSLLTSLADQNYMNSLNKNDCYLIYYLLSEFFNNGESEAFNKSFELAWVSLDFAFKFINIILVYIFMIKISNFIVKGNNFNLFRLRKE